MACQLLCLAQSDSENGAVTDNGSKDNISAHSKPIQLVVGASRIILRNR